MSNIDFFVKLRDAVQMTADAANEQLEKMAPLGVKYNKRVFDNLMWETKSGTKGDCQQTQ